MITEKELIENFCRLLKKISKKRTKNFSGIGMVVYNSALLPEKSHCDIRPLIFCPKGTKISEKSCLEYLLEISQTSHPLHDGFHFINERGELTHVAQYFVPPIVKGIRPNHSQGIRFRSAQYGSLIKGVITTGIINHNFEPYYFIKGKSFKL